MRGLIGKRLSHSFSKEIHEKLDQKEYNLIELSELGSFFQEKKFHSINVTIPYKSEVIPYLDYISDSAKEVNAVNTIVHEKGILKGYNTDIDGLIYTLDYNDISLEDKVVGILGNGSTSGTTQYVAKLKRAKSIKVFARNPKENEHPISDVKSHKDIQIIINTTPNGMYPNNEDDSLINVSDFPSLEFVLDLVYNPLNTRLILDAKKHGTKAANGLMMLIRQAVRANELFNKVIYDDDVTISLYKNIYLSRLNLVLIGMPMSGKSHYANQLAIKYDKDLIDIDKEIEYTQEKSIPEIFSLYGEKEFRRIESMIIRRNSKELNKAISTGGGVILDPKNIEFLRQNGIVIFLDVPLEQLMKIPPKGRPLLKDPKNLINLYQERYDLYSKYCDIKILKNGFDTEKTMRKIEVKLNEYINT